LETRLRRQAAGSSPALPTIKNLIIKNMINQQLLDYIKQQLEQGASREQIKSSLAANGWQAQDIEEGFNAINISALPEQRVNPLTKAPMKIWKIIVVSLVGAGIVGSGIYFVAQKFFKPEEKPKLSNELTQQLPKESASTTPAQEASAPAAPAILDCKQDLECLIQASVGCEPAKVIHSVITDNFGIKQTTVSFIEIKGLEAGRCNFYLRTEKIDLVFPADIPQEVINQQKEIYKKLEGRNGTCGFNTGDLTAMLTRWKKGIFESGAVSCELTPDGNICEAEGGDFGAAECQGTYFEQPSL